MLLACTAGWLAGPELERAQAHGDASVLEAGPTDAPDPESGVVFNNLRAAAAGRCAPGFRVPLERAPDACTHGPDPAPAGVDVREHLSVAELRAQAQAAAQPGERAAQLPCQGNGVSGDRAQAVYAHASDTPDRYAEVAPLMRSAAAAMSDEVEDSAAETGGYRTLRWVTAGCELDVLDVELSPAGDDSLGATADELIEQGLDRDDRKYVSWVDARVYCGIAFVRGNYARIDSGCWGEPATSLHELTHTLGAVSLDAPNTTGSGHCTDEYDVMCYPDAPDYPPMRYLCSADHERLLDCNHDDYFTTAPRAGDFLFRYPEENTADSSFLAERDGLPPIFLPTALINYPGPRYVLRLDNIDDSACAYVLRPDNTRVRLFCTDRLGAREVEITAALVDTAGGRPTARLVLESTERGGGYAFGYELRADGRPILDQREGEAGVSSATVPLSAPDPLTGWRTFAERTIELPLTGPSPATPPSPAGGNPAPAQAPASPAPAQAPANPAIAPSADTDAPQTKIKNGPRHRVTTRKARFRFAADEPSATFECRLDRKHHKRYRPCGSPVKVKVSRGHRHRFWVRAIDAAGNTDPTPAKLRWKVKRR